MDPNQLVGSFVVEIGFRQAWPFLGLCDNRPSASREVRLYIDATWTIEAPSPVTGRADDAATWCREALSLNGEAIDTVRVDDDGTLRLATSAGSALTISGEPETDTVGEAWWLSGWRPS